MTTTAQAPRRNTYAGHCACGRQVPALAGQLGPKVAGRWTVLCGGCARKPHVTTATATHAARATTRSTRSMTGQSGRCLICGTALDHLSAGGYCFDCQ